MAIIADSADRPKGRLQFTLATLLAFMFAAAVLVWGCLLVEKQREERRKRMWDEVHKASQTAPELRKSD
jgi:hypothetical protein